MAVKKSLLQVIATLSAFRVGHVTIILLNVLGREMVIEMITGGVSARGTQGQGQR